MEEPTALSILLSWVPMLLLVSVFLFVMWRSLGFGLGRGRKSQADLLQECMEEMRRMNQSIERIAVSLEGRRETGL